jgi:hypothetical protein
MRVILHLLAIMPLPMVESSIGPGREAHSRASYARPMKMKKAGNGNRTRMASLEGWNFTIKLCPHAIVNVESVRE